MWEQGGEEFTDGMILSVFLIDAIRYDALRTFLGFDLLALMKSKILETLFDRGRSYSRLKFVVLI